MGTALPSAGFSTRRVSSTGITLPTSETARDQKKTDVLQSLSGAKFDRRYIKGSERLTRTLSNCSRVRAKSKDDRLKSFASQTLPMLQDYLKMITGMLLTQKAASETQ